MTERRKQFLQHLMGLYQKTQQPVHYETLANAVGVSKWTAYDMLRGLEKLGYLSRDYLHPRGGVGRSQVVFRPTEKAVQLVSRICDNPSSSHGNETERDMIRLLQELQRAEMGLAMTRLIESVSQTPSGITFCLSLLGVLSLFLKNLDEPIRATVEHMTASLERPEARILVFIGVMFGIVIHSVKGELGQETARLIGRALSSIQELSEDERVRLADFLSEALRQVQ